MTKTFKLGTLPPGAVIVEKGPTFVSYQLPDGGGGRLDFDPVKMTSTKTIWSGPATIKVGIPIRTKSE